MSNDDRIELFENQPIRTAWNAVEEEWYFSIVDVVGVLTDSKDAAAYWRKLKQRLKDEGNETVTNCHGLKMTASDGKKRLTDVATTEQLLRIIQSIGIGYMLKRALRLALDFYLTVSALYKFINAFVRSWE